MSEVYRAPMRSRDDAVDMQATIDRALRVGLVGFGCAGGDERLSRRVDRFAAVADGAYVWTRDADGRYWLGRIAGPYARDSSAAAAAVDLVHVRPCRWLSAPVDESQVPAAVVATFGRGGRNFQRTHAPEVRAQTARVWERRE